MTPSTRPSPSRRGAPPATHEEPRESPRSAPATHERPVEAELPKYKAVYTVIDRGNGRNYWLRIGIAFVNRDQSLNVRLDALPVNGALHIRDPKPEDVEG